MVVALNFNINPILLDAGYQYGGDNGYFKLFTNRDIKNYNIKRNFILRRGERNVPRAKKGWRYHAIALSDFTFDLHIDCGNIYGHAYFKEHSLIVKEIERIKKI